MGEFREGKFHGQGTAVLKGGNTYVGEFRDGNYNGQGSFFWLADNQFRGNTHIGEWRNGKQHGRGSHTTADGHKIVGDWVEGQLTEGIVYSANGSVVRGGKWLDGKLILSAILDTNRFPFETSSNNRSLPALFLTFPAWTSDAEKHEQLNQEAKRVGEVLCGKATYVVRGVRSDGWGDCEKGGLWGLWGLQPSCNTNQIRGFLVCAESTELTVASIIAPTSNRENFALERPANAEVSKGKKRQDLEERLDAELKEGKLVTEPKESERLSTDVEDGRKNRQELELRLAIEIESERKKRQELEERLAAESKERERLAQEAKEREQQLAEAKEREQRTPSTPTPFASPKNPHALIIGNAAYPGSSRLDNPINDANAMEQKLKSMGFTVTVVTDANRQRLVQAMSQFRKTASNADLSLLFYSGHGVQIFGTNYILPIDVDQSDVAQATIQGVSLNSVVESFLPGKTKIVFLDACRDNPLQRSNDRSVSKGLAPISVAQGTLIAYATKDGQTASDGVGQKNSPFTKALLEHLSDPQDIAVILRKVREKVMTATGGKQQPWEYGSLTGGELVLSGVKR